MFEAHGASRNCEMFLKSLVGNTVVWKPLQLTVLGADIPIRAPGPLHRATQEACEKQKQHLDCVTACLPVCVCASV